MADIQIIDIPQNIKDYVKEYYCNLQINVNNTDVENGYGIWIHYSVVIYRYCEYCVRCGYNSLFNIDPDPKGENTMHQRHTLEREYVPVFTWECETNLENALPTLEHAFNDWLYRQPKNAYGNVVKGFYKAEYKGNIK